MTFPGTLFVLLVAVFLLAGIMLWPRIGLLALWWQHRQSVQRALAEDALKHLHACEWRRHTATLDSLAGALRLSPRAAVALARRMEAEGWLRTSEDGLRLTPEGEHVALAVIRAHRLWERYLADEARMPLTDIHAEAERREHDRAPETVQALDAAMGYPTTDPHGDPIPTAEGQLVGSPTQPLTDWPLNTPARIAHLEDEPAIIFSQIVAEGLCPGLVVRVIEANAQRVLLSDGERVHTLAPIVAANIFVETDGVEERPRLTQNLTALCTGQQATVCRLDDSLQGFTRRRLLDLGLTPGTTVTAEMRSLFGDPAAYRVRGTLIALRRDQAEKVIVDSIQKVSD
ncbi:MAG: FeoA domain-containing protein [Chloroflexota bacterium]